MNKYLLENTRLKTAFAKIRRLGSTVVDLAGFLFIFPVLAFLLSFIDDSYIKFSLCFAHYQLLLFLLLYICKKTFGHFLFKIRLQSQSTRYFGCRLFARQFWFWLLFSIYLYWGFLQANPYLEEKTYSAFVYEIQNTGFNVLFFVSNIFFGLDVLHMICDPSHRYLHERILNLEVVIG